MPNLPAHSHDAVFVEALTRHQPVLEAFCHAHLGSRHDAQEVLQNTNVKLWEKAADWNPDTEFLPWAFAVARFTLLSHLRDQSRDRLVFDEDVVHAMAQPAETSAGELPARRAALSTCLKRLNHEHRKLLQAHYLAGQTLREIARAARRGESAVKMTMLRLRQQLSACIQKQLGDGA